MPPLCVPLSFADVWVLPAPPTAPGPPPGHPVSERMCLLMSLSEQIHDSNAGNSPITGPEPGHPSFPHLPQPIRSQPQPPSPLHLPLLHPHGRSTQASSSPTWTPVSPLQPGPSQPQGSPCAWSCPRPSSGPAPSGQRPTPQPGVQGAFRFGPGPLFRHPHPPAASGLGPSSLLCLLPGHLPLHPPTPASCAPCLVLPHSDLLLHQSLVNRAQPPPGSPPSRLLRLSWCTHGCFCRPWASLS